MRKKLLVYVPIYALVLLGLILCSLWGGRTVTVLSENAPLQNRHCFVIDPGHGGFDGGAISCTGTYESKLNLEISLRLNDLMHLLGFNTRMLRTEDISLHTNGESIAARKASDLKERTRLVNETQDGILLCIHQNYYTEEKYSGGQIFYAKTQGSEELAKHLQYNFIAVLNPESHRMAKPAEGLYIMRHIEKPGVLIECGFLSNYEEEGKLRTANYQKKLCCVIAFSCGEYLTQYHNIVNSIYIK